MSTIRVRRLDANHDPVFGQGAADFLVDLDAMVQILNTRLLLFLAEWWEDQEEGLAMWQSMLGRSGANIKIIDGLISARLLATPYVEKIGAVSSSYDPNTRAYKFSATVTTQFGAVAVSNT